MYKQDKSTHKFPSTRNTSSGSNPNSAGNFPISLSLKSSSSTPHPGAFLFPLNVSAIPVRPSNSHILFPRKRRCRKPLRWGPRNISEERTGVVSEAEVMPLYDKSSVRREGKRVVRRGRRGSLVRGGVTVPPEWHVIIT